MGLSGLSAADAARLTAWKAMLAARRTADRRLGGFARSAARADAWARRWRTEWGGRPAPMAAWLARPGGGRLWLPAGGEVEWARSTCTDADVALADRAARGVFDLIGSGPVDLGMPPAWRRDLYSGREWPLRGLGHHDIVRGDGSDIRTVWELSRCRHFLALARAHARTGEPRYRDAFVGQVRSWIDDNPLGLGPHWIAPMDAAIRAANWILAASIFAHDEAIDAGTWSALLADLLVTGRFVERYLEWHPVYRGNHYVAEAAGLAALGVCFRGTPQGDRWLRTGARILGAEIGIQVGDDGVSFEGSIGYHRLVTECFAWSRDLLAHNAPGGVDLRYDQRLRAMYAFIAACLPADGQAPLLGDADDGRLFAMDAAAEDAPRRHALGLPDDWWPAGPPGPAAFPAGGFYVLRHGDDHCVVRCGAVGLRGAGSHDHNDQLAFELVIGARRVVADSGTYAYTRDLAARYAFRSTAAHGVLQVADEEQNPISVERPWRVLADRTRSACRTFAADADRQIFEGEHHGFAHRPSRARCRRRIEFEAAARTWTITDTLEGRGREPVTWRLHLAAGEVVSRADGPSAWLVRLPGTPAVVIRVALPPGLGFEVGTAPASDRYGTRYERPSLLARGEVTMPMRVVTTIARGDDA